MEDLIILGGTIIDGTGNPRYKADVAIKDGVITAIGNLSGAAAKNVLDASGLIVAPGFIDSHSHSDTCFLRDTSCASKLFQGITTEISGQCGSSPFPHKTETAKDITRSTSFGRFVDQFDQGDYSMAINQAMLVGHGSLRAAVIGYEDRPATAYELERMKELLRQSLEEGAWGLSLGLEYSPGFFADCEELQELGRVVHEFGGIVTCHMRNEGLNIAAAIEELVHIGRASGVHVHISHLKIDNFRVHGSAEKVWNLIESARREGVNITADMYPFTASATDLTIRCPKWCSEGGPSAVIDFLNGPRRQEIIEHLRSHYFNAERAETCLFSGDGGMWPEIIGKTLRYVAQNLLHTSDYAEAAAEVLIRTRARASCIFFVMSELDMMYFLSRDVGIGSDGYAYSGDPNKVSGMPHPRSYGAVSEFFRLARENNLCSLEEAVRRVTSKTADTIGLTDRGVLKKGNVADITVFDPKRIAPTATYLDPIRLSAGVHHVLIGGEIALHNGIQTELRKGKFLVKSHASATPNQIRQC